MDTNMLKELGFDKAAETLGKKLDLKKKLALAYEHYRFVEPHIFQRFQEQVKAKTLKIKEVCPQCQNSKRASECVYCRGTGASVMTHDKLIFMKLKDYPEVPPPDCLLDLKKAKEMGCFDSFEVAKVQTVEVRPDPIIFGLIDNCEDKFFITQWDDDVKIEDILNESEG